ncbi:MAG: YitT family protein [Bacteroidales bacterium]|nr:YitT family protein [Bacteroidales bacterium]MBO7321526.1 YitT family protein [Bacteroidales bacterium]MBO7763535.1 YitT family protein [Bacteroidales bacterium]MBQ2244133.1 YitT family protein [Bacteroidales bacterium]
MEQRIKRVLTVLKEYIIITLGLLCYTAGWCIFIIPHEMVGGGVSGIGALIYYATGFPVSYSYFIINFVLLLIALKVLGKGFGFKTVFAIVMASLFFKILPDIIPQSFIDEIAISNGKLMSAIIGGAISGVGITLTFSQGGSTGGTDIIALMITKYRNVSPGKIILYLDIIIIASSLLLPNDLNMGAKFANVVYGYMVTGLCASTLDLLLSGMKQSIQMFIFSKNYAAIADRISNELRRGVTVLDGQGWFSKQNGKVLLVIAKKTDMNFLYKIVKEEDKDAFMSEGSVRGVYGQGFDQIKK